MTQIPELADTARLECDVLVIGGGTAGTMAALTAAEHGAQVLLLEKVTIENRLMPVRVLTDGDRAVGAAALNSRTGEFVAIAAKAVILATGACGRLGLPASGYLYGTYENPTNAGDGYSMAYHAGAELSGIECFQVNPLIKDYNGPACAYVANPFGGYQVNALGERFVDSDYWSGQMMAEVKREIESARGPIYLKVSHLPDETLTALENILHTTERPTRGTFHANRGHDYRTHDVEMHISEIGLCSGHSASGVWVDEHARTTVPGLYAAGDLACVPHTYMIGALSTAIWLANMRRRRSRTSLRRRSFRTTSSRRRTSSSTVRFASRTARRSRRWNTSCAGSSTTTWPRPRPRRSCRSPCKPSSGCTPRSPKWGPPHRTS